jgi:hypothetical protein
MECTGWNPTSMPRTETQHAYIYAEPAPAGASTFEDGQAESQPELG